MEKPELAQLNDGFENIRGVLNGVAAVLVADTVFTAQRIDSGVQFDAAHALITIASEGLAELQERVRAAVKGSGA